VEVDGAEWGHDSEDEFFADFRRATGEVLYSRKFDEDCLTIQSFSSGTTMVKVEASDRAKIERVFEIFEQYASECRLDEPKQSLGVTGVTALTDPLKKTKRYSRTRFAADVIKEASTAFDKEIAARKATPPRLRLVAEVDDAEWRYDSEEEFFSGYRRGVGGALYDREIGENVLRIKVDAGGETLVAVEASHRSKIEAIFEIFERHLPESRLPDPLLRQDIVIFLGHGHGPRWRDLKDHLQDKHGFKVEAYEVGARAGHAVRDILENMLSKSSIAFLVMTAEDETAEGGRRARQNVVHEVGLFQGRLGFARGIVLLEEGAEEFSNINGIEQIRFSPGRIQETFGEVLATIRREFQSPPPQLPSDATTTGRERGPAPAGADFGSLKSAISRRDVS
jgi:hypothetical protein